MIVCLPKSGPPPGHGSPLGSYPRPPLLLRFQPTASISACTDSSQERTAIVRSISLPDPSPAALHLGDDVRDKAPKPLSLIFFFRLETSISGSFCVAPSQLLR